ncbi:hypothetical protein [Buttiauxella izardii]|uniref:hypothetical protein n=1 Tax=Buttiauxella izardii TaxID=82991 RepID=UPI00142D6643|nr:hypothetical protein [Buttiauxella izardii]
MTRTLITMLEELERLCLKSPDVFTAIEINVKGEDGSLLHGFVLPSEMLLEDENSHATH